MLACIGATKYVFLFLPILLYFKGATKIFFVLFASLGALTAIFLIGVDQNKIQADLDPHWVTITGYVQTQEVRSVSQQRLTIEIIQSDDTKLIGQTILVYTARYPEAKKGTVITSDCRLERPEPFDGFAYDRYLVTKSVFFLCRDAKITENETPKSYWPRPLEYPRIHIAQQIESLWPRPQSSLVLGLLLGTRESFPQITLTEFQRAGVTHIIALSGFNITILIVFLESIAIRLLIPKFVRLPLIVGGIIFFTIFVGAGASIVRAAIMGSLVLVGKYFARIASPLRLMLITATVMSMFNPFILLYDLGFQLSFLSTFGLLYLTPFFERLFFLIPTSFSLRESLATTMAATTTTLPLILFQFEQLSVVSPIANMLILPIIPWLMGAGALVVICSWVFPIIIPPLKWVVDFGCQYILSVSKIMSSFSWSSLPIKFSFTYLCISYFIIFIFILYVHKKDLAGK